jgi:ribonuclease Z
VTTNHSSDTEPQIVLEYDGNQYVFNAGENTCRVLVQSRPDLEKMKGMFLTQVSTQRAGGLGGEQMSVLLPAMTDLIKKVLLHI